jgi:Ca2+/Na+ antiporter
MSLPMNSLIHHLMLTTQVRTGFSPQGLICAAVAALSAAIAFGFGLLAAFVLLAQRIDSLTAGLALGGLFLAIAMIAGLVAILIRRRTIARTQRELAARRSAHWLDPRLLVVGLQSARRRVGDG